jgi:membrane-associated phospholipid phosphatase
MHTISKHQREERIKKGVFRFLSIKLVMVSSLFIFSLLAFAFIAHEVVYENEQFFDNKVFSFFSSLSSPGLIRVMIFFTFFGSSAFILPAYILLIFCFIVQKKFRYGLDIAIIAVSSTVLMLALKEITHRHRPALPLIQGITNYSFPSGHALSAFIFCGILIYIIRHSLLIPLYKWLCAVLLVCFAITIGISRIVLRVHFPTDVIASFCLGILWAFLSLWVMRMISKKNNFKKQVPNQQ